MGNVSGVAVAITMGGPGAIFWMWVSALLGSKHQVFYLFAGCYVSEEKILPVKFRVAQCILLLKGLGKNWKPVAIFFSLMGMIGVSPLFQANQLTQMIRDVVLIPNNIGKLHFQSDLITGVVISIIVAIVVIGGIKRIGNVTGRVVPLMVAVYVITVLYIILSNIRTNNVPAFKTIFHDAFTGDAVLGGSLGAIIITGVRRAAFSNEAGLGTAPMAHGAAKTSEPIREGLVAMLGPIIDTIIICTMTALAIIITNSWIESSADGISLTAHAFDTAIPVYGKYILTISVTFFAMSTLFAFPYYGTKCLRICGRSKVRIHLQLYFCTW